MNWIIGNWEYALLVYFVAEKVVKLTPTKYDDITLDIIWASLKNITKKNTDKESRRRKK